MSKQGRTKKRYASQRDSTRSLRRCRGIAPGFGMYLRLWLYADLRCPGCGSRGHWVDLPGVPNKGHLLHPKAADEARMSDYSGNPLRKGEDNEVWRCANAKCGRETYSPEARAWTQGGGPYTMRPHETRVFAGNVGQGFAWEHDEDDDPPDGVDCVVSPWEDVDDGIDLERAVKGIVALLCWA